LSSTPRIALDFSQLDSLGTINGQYRYAVDLVRGLARSQPAAEFLLLGSKDEPVDELRDVFRDHGDRWRYRQLPRRQFRGADYADHARYGLLLWRDRISLLHALHTFVPVLAPCPVVITMYDLMYEMFADYDQARRSRPYRIHKWAVQHRVRRIISISRTTAADLGNRWGVAADRIDVVPLGSDLGSDLKEAAVSQTRGDSLPWLPDSSRILLSPYNLEPRKNLAALLQATARLTSRYDDLKLVLFGRAAITVEREENFERAVRELGLSEKVIRCGVLRDDELAELYRRATLFVFPSLYEGFGLPLLEAMSVGACVVARQASAMAEVVGDAGVLVETAEPEALAAGIAELLGDEKGGEAGEGRRRELGRLARERAAAFSVERMAELTYESYLTTLNRTGLNHVRQTSVCRETSTS
jgi:glycosyltransferase involved in cell wall biosynthesis